MEYISAAHQKELDRIYRLTVILVLCFAFSALLFPVLGKILGPQGRLVDDLETYQKLVKGVYGAALFAGLLVVALRRLCMNVVLNKARGGQSVAKVLSTLRLLALLSAVVGEFVAVLGFVAFSLTGSYDFCWRLSGVSLLLILYSFPRRWEWQRLVAAHS